jgi:hypothetical protein
MSDHRILSLLPGPPLELMNEWKDETGGSYDIPQGCALLPLFSIVVV